MNSCSSSRPAPLRLGRFSVFSNAIQRVKVLLVLLAGIGQKRFCSPSV
ncbi:MAG: hypothetical protein ABL950_00595 [Nitrospira sp.]